MPNNNKYFKNLLIFLNFHLKGRNGLKSHYYFKKNNVLEEYEGLILIDF